MVQKSDSQFKLINYISNLVSTRTILLYVFSSFFLFSKKLPIVVVRDVCPSVRPSVCPSVRSSVEIISFRGNSLPNWPIELKIGLNVREGVVHVRKARFFKF